MTPTTVDSRRAARTRRAGMTGASLVEVLVAVLVLSLGLLGMAALQARALRGNVSSLQRTQAVMLSHYMLDAMRVDRAAAQGGYYGTVGSTFICNPAAFNGGTLAQTTLASWLTAAKAQIGSAADTTTCVKAACDANFVCTVQIQWDDSLAGGLGTQTLSFSSRI